MREIKFRGREESGHWYHGDLFLTDDKEYAYIVLRIKGHYPRYEVDPATVGQFTGVHDKNGREIYEGDIIENGRGWRHCVKYRDGFAGFVARGGTFPPLMNQGSMNFYTVIGNIHDNPELLEQN